MKCKACDKEHPPEEVTWSERNSSQQPRPYHCPRCWQTRRKRTKRSNWDTGPVRVAKACTRHGAHEPAPGGCCLKSN